VSVKQPFFCKTTPKEVMLETWQRHMDGVRTNNTRFIATPWVNHNLYSLTRRFLKNRADTSNNANSIMVNKRLIWTFLIGANPH